MTIAVVGCGRVGSAMAVALAGARRGIRFTGACGRRSSASAGLVRRCRAGRPFGTLAEAAAVSDTILLCVPDDAVAGVARRLAAEANVRGKVVLHTSGALGLGPLRALARCGASVGSLHPLAVFPEARPRAARPALPRGIWYAADGSREVITRARRIAAALGGRAVRIPRGARSVYHLAASLVANHVTVLAALALDLLRRRGGLRGSVARRAFAALLRSAAERIERDGPERALTGPAARGDIVTIRRHLAVLRSEPARVRAIYSLLSAEAVDLAARRGALAPPLATRTLRALGVPRPGPRWRRPRPLPGVP